MKILAVIPARGGSKGIPRKNIKILGNKPLLAYTIEKALHSKLLDTVMVSTEDIEIAVISARYGLPVPFLRPEILAQDNSPTLGTVQHVLSTYSGNNVHFDAVMILEPTSPFRGPNEIDESVKLFIDRNSDSLISVKKVPDDFNPYWVYEENQNPHLLKPVTDNQLIPRRQNLPTTFVRDGSVYITKTKVIMEQNSLFGDSIAYKVNNCPFRVNIDTLKDWNEAERMLSSGMLQELAGMQNF